MHNQKASKQHPEKDLEDGIKEQNNDSLEEQLTESTENFEEKCVEAEEKYKRVLADYRNLEQRVQVERSQYVKTANRFLIESLLEPLDFMETATKHIDDKGLQMVIDRFHQVFQQEGLEEIAVKIGDKFDEKIMEAIDTTEGEEGSVTEVRQKGFRLNGIVLRHTKVAVGKD